MNGISEFSRSLSSHVVLLGSSIGLGFLPPSSSNLVNSPLRTTPSSKAVSPTLSVSDSAKSVQFSALSDPACPSPVYTQNQLECAERLGVDPLDCTSTGTLMDQRRIEGFIGTVVSTRLLALTLVCVGLAIYFKIRHYHSHDQKKAKAIRSVFPKEVLFLKDILKNVELGKLRLKYIVGLKNKHTGRTLLHSLAKNQPELIDIWVLDGHLDVEKDLGDKKKDYLDNSGNTVLHVIARNHPKIIDKWVREDLVSLDYLDKVKNQKDQSVQFYIEHVDSDIFQAWIDDGILDQRTRLLSHCIN